MERIKAANTGDTMQSFIGADGKAIRYLDTGSGEAVLMLASSIEDSPLRRRLASDFRVIALELSADSDPNALGGTVLRVADGLGVGHFSLVGGSEIALPALALAIDFADRVDALVLIAPPARPMPGPSVPDNRNTELSLEKIQAPTLVLYGTREEPALADCGRYYARRIATCFHAFVYDAGHQIEADCPDALGAAVSDFLQYREKFVVAHDSSAVRP